jgi:hypothetical protein
MASHAAMGNGYRLRSNKVNSQRNATLERGGSQRDVATASAAWMRRTNGCVDKFEKLEESLMINESGKNALNSL